MKSVNILVFFYVFIFIIKISYQSSYIILPFKTSTKEKKVYPDNLLQNDVEVTLNIGTPPQSIDLNLRSKAYTFSYLVLILIFLIQHLIIVIQNH